MTEKRFLLATALSVAFLSFYAHWMQRFYPRESLTAAVAIPQEERKNLSKELEPAEEQRSFVSEDVTKIESSELELVIGRESGSIKEALPKPFHSSSGTGPLRVIGGGRALFSISAGTKQRLIYQDHGNATTPNHAEFTVEDGSYTLSYNIRQDVPIVDVEVVSSKPQSGPVLISSSLEKTDGMNGRYGTLEAFILLRDDKANRVYKHYRISSRDRIVPRGTSKVTLTDRFFCSVLSLGVPASTTIEGSVGVTSTISSKEQLAIEKLKALNSISMSLYIGPRDYFHMRRAGVEDAIPIGTLGKLGLVLVMVLNWVARVAHNYGVAIIIFSVLVTLSMSPFTLISIRSMKKMQAIKPEIDRLMAQHKDNQKRMNQEMLRLYKENKVSPLSGCLPTLLQMPIFIALFQALSHVIEIRGKRFLWISDLSLPDRIAQLPIALPIIGKDVNLLPVVMAALMFFQSRFSMKQMPSSANSDEMTKMFSGPMMAIMFGLMFYGFPSGLVLYWMTNTVMSIVLFRAVKS